MKRNEPSSSRRDVLKGVSVGIPALLTGSTYLDSAAAAGEGDVLGDFSDGVDGWRSPGPYRENRVEAGQAPVITTGDHGLQVPFAESRTARIVNDEQVRETDLVDADDLVVRLAGSATGTDSPFVFFSRIHYTGPPIGVVNSGPRVGAAGSERDAGADTGGVPSANANGNGNANGNTVPPRNQNDVGNGKRGPPRNGNDTGNGESPADETDASGESNGRKPVVQSDPVVVPQQGPNTVTWDLSELHDQVLENARRVEICWFLAGYPPAANGPDGGYGSEDVRGTVLFDHVRLDAAEGAGQRDAFREKRRDLRRQHGRVTDRETLTDRGGIQHELLVYDDGTEVHHAVVWHEDPSTLNDDERPHVTHVLDGERFVFGGDQ